MIKNLIGNKQTFAIEYSVLSVNPSPPYGDCLIWLENNSLGGLEGECYLTMIYSWLKGSVNVKEQLFLKNELSKLSDVEIFKFMEEQDRDEIENYYFLDTEGFDLFRNYIYRKENFFHFLWQLDRDYWNEFSPRGISTNLHTAQVSIPTYIDIVGQFKHALSEIYNKSFNW